MAARATNDAQNASNDRSQNTPGVIPRVRALGYVRWSPRPDRGGYTKEMQLAAIERYCLGKDWELARVYEDELLTGKTMEKRKALAEMLQASRSGEFGAVVCYKVDRLARNLRGLLNMIEELGRYGVVFASTDLRYLDPRSPFGKAMLQMIGTFAELEGNLISERTRDGLATKPREVHSGNLPAGYYQHVCEKLGHRPDGCPRSGRLYLDEKGKEVFEALRMDPDVRPRELRDSLGLEYQEAYAILKNVKSGKFGTEVEATEPADVSSAPDSSPRTPG